MNKSESKYFNTAIKMNQALLSLLEKKEYEYITVKEICKEANVNRSTFYLHYETIHDLLQETIQYINKNFMSYFNENHDFVTQIHVLPLDDLLLINKEYLEPYLKYMKDNKKIFRTAILNNEALDTHNAYGSMFKHIFNPILERFHVPKKERKYIITYYIHGIIAIIDEWLKNDCEESIDEMIEVIIKCVLTGEKSV